MSRFLFAAALLAFATAARADPPPAPVRPVADDYFGHHLVDRYRWLERSDDPEAAAWVRAQDQHTRDVLAAIPGRAALLRRIGELGRGGSSVSRVRHVGAYYFHLAAAAGTTSQGLYVRDGATGRDRLLVDPLAHRGRSQHAVIEFYSPSPDGRLVAFGVALDGAESSTLRVADTATGKLLPDALGCDFSCFATWEPDGRAFYYRRQRAVTGPDAPSQKMRRGRLGRHLLGTSTARDTEVFGHGLSPDVVFDEADFPWIAVDAGSPWAVAMAWHAIGRQSAWVAPLADLRDGKSPHWRKLYGIDDGVNDFTLHGDDLYLLSYRDAPRFRVLKTSLGAPDVRHAAIFVAEHPGVVTDFVAAKDALYFKVMEGGPSHLERAPWNGAATANVPLPFTGAVLDFTADRAGPGTIAELTGWTRPTAWIDFDPATGKSTVLDFGPSDAPDFSAIEAREVEVPSADGTRVPLSILARKDLPRDGSHPTLLAVYGSHGIPLEPSFHPERLAWLERGGVLAFAHPRGGGEYGEGWHNAGRKLAKMNGVLDFLACAQWLVDEKYTSPAHLGAIGGSAAGMILGRAITDRPDLFAAVVSQVGVHNAVRLEAMPHGAINAPEMGTIATPEGFAALYLADGYHHVSDGDRYPAVLFTAGANDPRVPVWQVSKMAARLQAASSSGRPILLRVDYAGGHGVIGADRAQLDLMHADEWSFLLAQMGDPAFTR